MFNNSSMIIEQNFEIFAFSPEQKEKFIQLWEKVKSTSNEVYMNPIDF